MTLQSKPDKPVIAKKTQKVFYCDQTDCTYQAKTYSHVKRHKANVHDIDVTYYYCSYIDNSGSKCEFRGKQIVNVNSHKANVHLVGVIFHPCLFPNCKFKSKTSSNLKSHLKKMHGVVNPTDIGNGINSSSIENQFGTPVVSSIPSSSNLPDLPELPRFVPANNSMVTSSSYDLGSF